MNKNKIALAAFLAVLFIAYLLLYAVRYLEKPILHKLPSAKEFLKIEQGPQSVGWSHMWLLKHKETGMSFIYVERSSGGIFLLQITNK